MRHVWQNEVRGERRQAAWEPIENDCLDPAGETPETLLTRKLLRSEIIQAVDSLPEVYREVLLLREIENLSYAEIAEVLNCPQGTVMSRLARARLLLRRQLAKFAPPSREVSR